ncbi:hypothetical protein HanPI659440_Chr11g0419691 [Helianthus annuus]|nr:hypothetical protein HanPI659440_Chr11g0419691 [Helianthus annuus]
MQEEQPIQVARCTKIINPNTEDAKYVINVKQIAKFAVGLVTKFHQLISKKACVLDRLQCSLFVFNFNDFSR